MYSQITEFLCWQNIGHYKVILDNYQLFLFKIVCWICARYLLLRWLLQPLLMWDEISVNLWSWEMLPLFVQDLTGDVRLSSFKGRVKKEEHMLSFLNERSHRIEWLPKISILSMEYISMEQLANWPFNRWHTDNSACTTLIWGARVSEN